jgi:phospholipid-binding lipoprotein MlaA
VKRQGYIVVVLLLAAHLLLFPLFSQAQETPDELTGPDEAWLESLDEGDEYLDEYAARLVADPLEPLNRVMFTFNDRLYFWVLKPAAKGYSAVVPETVRRGVGNFFYNIRFPIRFVNNILQGKFMSAALEFDRFFINTFFGGLGLADLSDRHPELRVPREDTGQTLGKYGFGNGIYIVWPLLGPSTLRDSVGLAGDFFLDPLSYVDPSDAATGAKVGDRVNVVSFSIGEYEAIKAAAFDPYVAIRDGYIQYRQSQIEK